jgi:hypothetical protein
MVDVHAWSDSSESANYTQYQIASRDARERREDAETRFGSQQGSSSKKEA